MKALALTVLPERLAICRLPAGSPVPEPPPGADFWSATATRGELSVVLPERAAPAEWTAERGWRAIAVAGPLDFSWTGILAALAAPLAAAGVSLFAISTYDTDYVLLREADLERARQALTAAGHRVEGI
jgi:hypothetical protein